MARGGMGEALDVLLMGPREAKAVLGVSSLWKVELLFWLYYLPKFLPLDIVLQATPLKDRPYGDFRFGETPYATALEILKECQLQPGQLLMDLGCGRGKMVFTAALACGARAIGVELLPTYWKIAQKMRDRLGLQDLVEFWLEDFTLVEVFQADVVYVAGSIFAPETKEELLALVEQLQPGCRWVTVGWPCDHPLLELTSSQQRLFSWGYEVVRIYRVRPEPDPIATS